ncbi:MAG TPA: M14 family metallopeptidase [Blastocatellia bacterium]|nr:M14 family metallopeptidase [Blastocatellia bacterium]
MRLLSTLCCLMLLLLPMNANANQPDLRSRAEISDYKETSRYADVMEFIARLQSLSEQVKVESFGVSGEGRPLPLVILSKPATNTPAEAARSGKPIVFIMANIHAGEVEGKEATLHLMREIVTGQLSGLLDKIILLVAPIYNADGNEKISISNRTAQNGPEGGVGTRENGAGLDLNRDFMKLESPEARGLIGGVFNRWDPHVVIDLHTTNGSYHGYALTFSPSLNPNADRRIIAFAREKLLPDVSKTLRTKNKYETYFYGNFSDQQNPARELDPNKSADPKAWATFDYRPRFGNNYVGLRNRIAILSEAYSYIDFRKRVDVTDKFVRAVLQYVADNAEKVIKVIRDADAHAIAAGTTIGNEEGFATTFKLRPSAKPVEILVGSVTRVNDPRATRPRLVAGDQSRPVKMTEYGEFEPTRRVKPPAAYILKPDQHKAVDLLMAHGVAVEKIKKAESIAVEQYVVKSVARAQRAFQGHKETKVTVTNEVGSVEFPEGSYIISMNQPLAALIFYLLEPESDDGLVNWNFLDQELDRAEKDANSATYPVYRSKANLKVPRELLKK